MAFRFGYVAPTIVVALLLYFGILGFEVYSFHQAISLCDLWADATVDTLEPNEIPWLIYLSWSFFALSTFAFRFRAQSLALFSWQKFCTASFLLIVCASAAFFVVCIAFDTPGEIGETDAIQGLIAFGAIYLASLLAFSGLLPAVCSAFQSHQAIGRRALVATMVFLLLLGLACGLLGSAFSIDCYIDAKFYED